MAEPVLKLMRCPNGCEAYQNVKRTNPFTRCARCGARLVTIAALGKGE